MQKLVKFIFIFILLISLLYAFSGSYASHSIDNLAYVIALGVDTSETDGKIKVSFQFADTSTFSKDASSSDSSIILDTVEANSIDSAINLINSYVGKNVNLAHCKVIVFSEDVAKQGLSKHIYTLINNPQIRPTSNIIISKCDANSYIKNSSSNFEKIITTFYEIFPKSADYTGYTSNTTLGDFFNQLNSNTSGSVAILGGDGSAISGDRKIENAGLAVFKGDVLVGELNALDTLCYSIITNKVDTFLVSIPDPDSESETLDISAKECKKASIDIDTSGSSPYIKINIYLNARIASAHSSCNYLNENYLIKVQDSVNNYLSSRMSEYLYKTSTEFKTSIGNLDKYAYKNFLTTEDWNAYNWNTCYPNAIFDVNVHTKVDSSKLLTEN